MAGAAPPTLMRAGDQDRLHLLGRLGIVVTALCAVTVAGFSFMYLYSYYEHGFDWMEAGGGPSTVGYLLLGAVPFVVAGVVILLASLNVTAATSLGRPRQRTAQLLTRGALGVALPLILIGGLEIFGVWAFGGWGDPENLAGRIAWVAALGAVGLDLALLIIALVIRAPAA